MSELERGLSHLRLLIRKEFWICNLFECSWALLRKYILIRVLHGP